MNGIDELVEIYAGISNEETKIKYRKEEVATKILDLIKEKKKRGSVSVSGNKYKVKVEFKENISYPDKEKLEVLSEKINCFLDLFNVSFSERTAEVEKYLLNNQSDVAKELSELRVVKEGKPSIKIELI